MDFLKICSLITVKTLEANGLPEASGKSAEQSLKKWPYPETLAKLADALDVPIADLFSSNTSRKDSPLDAVEMLKFVLERQQQALTDIYKHFFGLVSQQEDDNCVIL